MADVRKFNLPAGRGRGRGAAGRGAAGRGRGAAPAEKKELVIPPEKQRELLQAYVELPREFWPNLQIGNQIRYVDKEGKFRPGGTIKVLRMKSGGRAVSEKEVMILHNPFANKQWGLAWDNISKIYLLPDVTLMLMKKNIQTAIQTIVKNLDSIAKKITEMEGRLKACEKALGRA